MMELLRQMAEQLRGIEFPPEAQENVNAAIAYLDCAFYDMCRPAPRALEIGDVKFGAPNKVLHPPAFLVWVIVFVFGFMCGAEYVLYRLGGG